MREGVRILVGILGLLVGGFLFTLFWASLQATLDFSKPYLVVHFPLGFPELSLPLRESIVLFKGPSEALNAVVYTFPDIVWALAIAILTAVTGLCLHTGVKLLRRHGRGWRVGSLRVSALLLALTLVMSGLYGWFMYLEVGLSQKLLC